MPTEAEWTDFDLAALIAKRDPDAELKAAAVGEMSFRRADRHVADVLSTANDDTFDFVYRRSYLEEINDKNVQERLAAARARSEIEVTEYERLRATVYARDGKDMARSWQNSLRPWKLKASRTPKSG